MKTVRVMMAGALCVTLQGCWFVYIPGSLIDKVTGNAGNLCVSETVKVGDRITMGNGTTRIIETISGVSYRCNADTRLPILATGV